MLILGAILSPAIAAKGLVAGSEMPGFGRIVFTLDREVVAKTRIVNSVLIIEFDEAVTIDMDKLALQLPNYVTVARADPDGRSLRLGLNDRFKIDLKPAGERLYLDLMPPKWQGMPPPLPAEVVQELVRRARQAEDQLRKLARESEKVVNRDILLKVGSTAAFRRAIFSMPRTAPITYEEKDGRLTLIFDANFLITREVIQSRLAGLVQDIEVETGEEMLRITMQTQEGITARGFREDDSFTLDFARADGAPIDTIATAPPADDRAKDVAAPKAGTATEPDKAATSMQPVNGEPAKAAPPAESEKPVLPVSVSVEQGQDAEGFALRVSNLRDTPIAVVQRGRELTILIETGDSFNMPMIPAEIAGRMDGLTLHRMRGASLIRLSPQGEGQFWLQRVYDDLIIQRGRSTTGADGFSGASVRVQRTFDGNGREALAVLVGPKGGLHFIDDPVSGQRLGIVPAPRADFASHKAQGFAEFSIEPTLAGFAVLALDEAVKIQRTPDRLIIGHEIKLNLSNVPADPVDTPRERQPLMLDSRVWLDDTRGEIRAGERALFRAAAEAPKVTRSEARLRLAQFYLANALYPEANAVLDAIVVDDHVTASHKRTIFLRALASAMMGRLVEGARLLREPALGMEAEQKLLQAVIDAKAMRYPMALANFKQATGELDRYPEDLQAVFRPLAVAAAIESEDAGFAREQLLGYEKLNRRYRNPHLQHLLAGRLAESQGRTGDAFAAYSLAAQSADRQIEAEARFGRAATGLADGKIAPEDARSEFETLSAIWRRSEVEIKALAKLGEIYAAEGRWREAFLTAQRATGIMPEHPVTRQLEEAMGRRFENLFLNNEKDRLSKVETLALYQEFRQLIPIGRRGDEIARRLADRLYDLDLAGEAANILEHQVKNRLEGVARASVATRLAVIHLESHQPRKALAALHMTRLASMPAGLRRARALLEARALGDLFRTDLAIEVVANEQGEDVDRLRADIYWKGKRWREAGEHYERVLGDSWQGEAALTDGQRLDAIRSGLAYVLADEKLSLDRLRGRFLAKMAKSDDAGSFDLVTRDHFTQPQAFRDVARQVVNADTMVEFMASYRKRYPDTGGQARPVRRADGRQSALERRQDQPPPGSG